MDDVDGPGFPVTWSRWTTSVSEWNRLAQERYPGRTRRRKYTVRVPGYEVQRWSAVDLDQAASLISALHVPAADLDGRCAVCQEDVPCESQEWASGWPASRDRVLRTARHRRPRLRDLVVVVLLAAIAVVALGVWP